MSFIESYYQKYKRSIQTFIFIIVSVLVFLLMPVLVDILFAYGNYVGTIARQIIEEICPF